jgi:amidase
MNTLNNEMDRRGFLRSLASLTAVTAMPAVAACRASAESITADPTVLSASALSRAIRQGKFSCVDVMHSYLSRIERYNPVYNAIVSLPDADHLLKQATLADQALDQGEYWGWMHGMPHAVKDLANVRDLETSQGSPIFAGTVADADDLFVSRIRKQGAIFIGKTNTPEFGYGSQSYNPVHGTTRNAYDPKLTAGGSSGGAAVGLASHMLPVADGSDMMGSLRNPAAFNNVIGFRPSQGRVPKFPGSDLYYQQLAVHGPMGRNVEDTIRLLGTMAGYDARFPLSLRNRIPPFEAFRVTDLNGLRIGWMRDFNGYLETEPGVLDLCEQSLQVLSAKGAIVENCMPEYDMARLWQTWLTLRHWSAGWARSLYDDPDKRKLLKPEVIFEVEGSIDMLASRVRAAGIARADWDRALHELFQQYDFLVLPSAQVFPFGADRHWPKMINDKKMDTYHRWMEVVIGATLAGVPVVNLPAGFDQRGRPMGMQFMGRSGEDVTVLEFALVYEAVTEYLLRRPDLVEAHG